jgi:hypothetical protein
VEVSGAEGNCSNDPDLVWLHSILYCSRGGDLFLRPDRLALGLLDIRAPQH